MAYLGVPFIMVRSPQCASSARSNFRSSSKASKRKARRGFPGRLGVPLVDCTFPRRAVFHAAALATVATGWPAVGHPVSPTAQDHHRGRRKNKKRSTALTVLYLLGVQYCLIVKNKYSTVLTGIQNCNLLGYSTVLTDKVEAGVPELLQGPDGAVEHGVQYCIIVKSEYSTVLTDKVEGRVPELLQAQTAPSSMESKRFW